MPVPLSIAARSWWSRLIGGLLNQPVPQPVPVRVDGRPVRRR